MLLFHRRNRMPKKGSSLVQTELSSPLRLWVCLINLEEHGPCPATRLAPRQGAGEAIKGR